MCVFSFAARASLLGGAGHEHDHEEDHHEHHHEDQVEGERREPRDGFSQ